MSFNAAYSTTSRRCTISPAFALQLAVLFLSCFSLRVSAWFVITEPNKNVVWSNNRTNVLRWNKGLLDGVNGFDVELSRMKMDGLTLIARNVPTHKNFALNIHLTDVPPGDDYILLLINATHGHMHAISQRFAIVNSAPSAQDLEKQGKTLGEDSVGGSATVTVSGAPHPTKGFATTFPPVPGAAGRVAMGMGGGVIGGLGMVVVSVGLGAVIALV